MITATVAVVFGMAAHGSPTPVLANPAAVYCVRQGGRSEIVQTPAGAQGLCVFPDGRRIDEWTLFRREGAREHTR